MTNFEKKVPITALSIGKQGNIIGSFNNIREPFDDLLKESAIFFATFEDI